MNKRVIAVSVKMSEADWNYLKRAAAKLWPEAIISDSSLVLGLAKKGAATVLKK